jgi:hypothetical protein
LCAPAKGASSTPASPTFPHTSCRPSQHMALCRVGAGHRRALAKGAPGLHPPTGCHRQILQMGRGAPNHESQGRASRNVLHRHNLPVWIAQLHHHR